MGREDALLSFQFSVHVLGVIPIRGYFREISGLTTEIEVVEHKTVDIFGRSINQRVPGRQKPGLVTLKRGITSDMGFWIWYEAIALGGVAAARAAVAITLHDRHYGPAAQYDLLWAWPSKISGPQIRSDANEVAVEELTLVYESMIRSPFPSVAVGWS